jgi:hypothetical protein
VRYVPYDELPMKEKWELGKRYEVAVLSNKNKVEAIIASR